ncbi:MAG: hypothetical protein K2M10_05420 [Muribaculaceae bacterium]|nr:hypothetical protein [Muribaculaceae bacterium]
MTTNGEKIDRWLIPAILIVIGVLVLSGMEVFGAALLEGAAWKQNVLFMLIIIFAMLPPEIQRMKGTYIVELAVFFGFTYLGIANLWGAVAIVLWIEKIVLAVMATGLLYRAYRKTWNSDKLLLLPAVATMICVILLLPIEDQNIVGSSINVLREWRLDAFTDDKGFHLYLGLTGIFAGITEYLLRNPRKTRKFAKD